MLQYACVVDTPSRVIVGDVITQSINHTSAIRIERCDADLFLYAGVEYGDECHRARFPKTTSLLHGSSKGQRCM